MKAFYAMFVVFAVLLFAAPMASAQDSGPSCTGGSAYDLTGHGCEAGYLNGSAATESIAPKVAGLAAPAQTEKQAQGWPGCPWGAAYDPMAQGYVPACFSRPADNAAAPKTAGLAKLAPAEAFIPCGSSEQLDPLLDPQALACLSQPVTAAKAASKPAGLAQLAPAADPEQGLCPWGDKVALAGPNYVPQCIGKYSATSAALKPVGLAAPAPVVDLALISRCLSYAGPNYSVCVVASSGASAAAKPAGLAAPAPVVAPEQGWPGCPWGAAYDPMAQGYIWECMSRPAANAAAPKTAGLAKLAPVEAFVPCGFGERLDPLALACLSGPDSAAKTASKPAGLAAPAQEISSSLCDAGESPYRCP